jgi:hypothetical protein
MANLGKRLKKAGFERIGTGAYEGDVRTMKDLNDVLRIVLNYLDNIGPGFRVDHLWVYADTPDTR